MDRVVEARTSAERDWEGSFQPWKEHLRTWLDSAEWSEAQILRWMAGLEVPAEDVRTDPHLWLLRGVEGWTRRQYAPRLALRAAAVVRNRSILADAATEGAKGVLYNLLYLCGGLNRPDELCDSLDEFFQNADLRDQRYQDVPLTTALRAALVWNQSDGRWAEYWYAMMRSEPDARLPGLPLDGFDAILIGWPEQSAAEVGRALAEMAKWVESRISAQDERDSRFMKLIERAERRERKADVENPEALSAALMSGLPSWAIRLSPAAVCIVNRYASGRSVNCQELLQDVSLDVHRSGYTAVRTIVGIVDHRARCMAAGARLYTTPYTGEVVTGPPRPEYPGSGELED